MDRMKSQDMDRSMDTMPDACALINGMENSKIQGIVCFYGVHGGTLVNARISGLPENQYGNFYGFHIHEGTSCTGDNEDSFKNSKGHYNPTKQEHPYHAGDLPVLMGNDGRVCCEFYTNRFYPEDVIGRTVVIHDMPDDFRSQPSGDSGRKIACGEIQEL